MCYIAFIGHSLHWRYINAALQEYVMIYVTTLRLSTKVRGFKENETLKTFLCFTFEESLRSKQTFTNHKKETPLKLKRSHCTKR